MGFEPRPEGGKEVSTSHGDPMEGHSGQRGSKCESPEKGTSLARLMNRKGTYRMTRTSVRTGAGPKDSKALGKSRQV